ncbi:HPC2 multi-domain protein [Streptomyces hydrogenans]|uniref:phage tail protein n=1 Tax=Streptomyces hydrogenans TaxID=1873719 RepID=UPI00363EBC01
MQRLQGAVGNAAVARLVAQRYTAPVKTPANAAPGFRRVGADVAAKKRTMAAHAPAAAESKSAQDAAVAPPDDKEAQGKAANAEKMNAAKPGEFDKAAFVAAVDKAIEAQAPKNLDEADKFSKSGKADKVKDEVDGKVTDGKNTSAKDIETTTKAPPDTSAAKDKPVTPMTPDNAPGNPGAPSAADAIPEKQPPAVTDFSQGPAENDKAMADAEVTEEQLAKGNEPEFDDALKAKKTAETDSAKAPGKAHTAEDQQLATAKAGAAAAGAQAMNTLTATRAAAGKAVDGGKGETKSKDERKRAEVTAKLQKVFDATKKDVETTLTGLDQKVDTAFTTGEKSARDAFTADHKARMKKYKDKRYGGFLGKGRWLKDKFAGMPQEANDLYQESRKLYVARMRTVISSVADMIGVELGRAKARIAQGRSDLKAEVDKLPADLKSFGEEAQQDFAGKFEDLEASVDEKSQQLVQDLANKYTAALNAVDEEIKKLQEANKGLIDKAKDAIVGVIKTINELKNLLLGILAKAASAIMKIIKDPIGFLGNLVKAVGAGLNLFVANIGDHLKKGLVSWLLGTATKAGLEIPERFDLRGIITLITSLLGLTWDNIRTRITRKGVPEEAMTAVESSVPVAQSLAKEGPAGAVKEIEAEAGDLKSTILSKLTEYLVPTVIIAGVTWILSLLNPASAFVRAVKGIIDIVTFVVNQGAQIADFVNAVLDAVIEIANGGAAGVPKMVETALAASIPLLIGFLASLLGIGNLASKVKSVFQAVSKPVNRAIDKIVDFIAKKGKVLWQKLKGKAQGGDDSPAGKQQRLDKALAAARSAVNRYGGRTVAGSVLTPLLRGIRARYGLTVLEPFVNSEGKWAIRGKVNPEGATGTNALAQDEEKRKKDAEAFESDKKAQQFVAEIPVKLPPFAKILTEEIAENWWASYLEDTGAWEGKEALGAFSDKAVQEMGTEETKNKLKGYFDPSRNEHGKKRREGPDATEFKNYALRTLGPKPPHSVRPLFYELLGKSAEDELKKNAKDEIKQGDLREKLEKLTYQYNKGFGAFSSLPVPTRETDPELKAAAGGRIVAFLTDMAEEGNSLGFPLDRLQELWTEKVEKGRGENPHSKWLKAQFRGDGGLHEWIPTNQMLEILDAAISQKETKGPLGWIVLQDSLRSFTTDVIWEIRLTDDMTEVGRYDMDAHVGAFTNKDDGNPIFNGRDRAWHESLRGYFREFRKERGNDGPLEYLDVLQDLLESGKLMWKADDAANFTPKQLKLEVRADYRSIHHRATVTDETQRSRPLTVEELIADQQRAYERVLEDFLNARAKVSAVIR